MVHYNRSWFPDNVRTDAFLSSVTGTYSFRKLTASDQPGSITTLKTVLKTQYCVLMSEMERVLEYYTLKIFYQVKIK